jgi:hypothetical protein
MNLRVHRVRNPEHALRHMEKNDRAFLHRLKEEYRVMEEKKKPQKSA